MSALGFGLAVESNSMELAPIYAQLLGVAECSGSRFDNIAFGKYVPVPFSANVLSMADYSVQSLC